MIIHARGYLTGDDWKDVVVRACRLLKIYVA
jgi:hypothetical protein